MPEANVQTMALADRYAAAMIEAAKEKSAHEHEHIFNEYADFIGYLDEDPQFEAFLTSQNIESNARRASLEKLFRGRMSDLLLNTLQVLNRHRRCDLVRKVYRCAELRIKFEHQQQEVKVITAIPLKHELETAIRNVISGWIGKSAIVIEEVRPELLGGIIIQAGDIRIDGSLLARVENIRKRLMVRITEEIHQGQSYEV